MPEDPYAYVVAAFQALPPPDYVPGPEEPEQAPPSPPLPATASPTADSPGYIPESDPDDDPEDDDEDPEEDPADYPADHDDDDEEEEEPSGDDADEENEEADRPKVTLPPQKRLSIVHCPGYKEVESSVAAVARPIEGRRTDYGFVDSVEAEI
nr:hypothetical protein [Tanacetum cinerariifolium]